VVMATLALGGEPMKRERFTRHVSQVSARLCGVEQRRVGDLLAHRNAEGAVKASAMSRLADAALLNPELFAPHGVLLWIDPNYEIGWV